ncbi:hypothetical protein [Pseudomonas syringae group genomosp. 7]|uniref:hypothetical protein n=1 Tax=Pseudomonas syringae group genomosp. 7 TaxID=251699 RepID=UPI000F3C7CE3|nr:hypothetical protein [Pseudomonas syringae group genomosp. 7]RMQ99967.1 hypothetical protein ALP93_200257 [Pseudomonas syringae pv. helianthi]
MNDRHAAGIVAALLLLMLLILLLYNSQFGFTPSDSKGDWGTFGDYFGGILNPIIGMLGFIGILRSLRMQQLQLNTMKRDKLAEEVLEAVKDIDKRINESLASSVGFVRTTVPIVRDTELFISHMVAEGQRGAKRLADSPGYNDFTKTSNEAGSVVGVAVAEIRALVVQMADLVRHHPSNTMNEYSPVLFYYVSKTAKLIPMLKDIGGIPETTVAFYEHERWNRHQAPTSS